MAGFANFAGVNPNFFFQSGPYPGASAFDNALKQYQTQLNTAPQQGQLAAGQSASAPAQAYAGQKASPTGSGDAFARGAFSQLMGGQEKARTAGNAATSGAALGAVGGAEDVASAYGQSMQGQLQGQLAEQKADEAKAGGVLGDITSGLETAAGIGSEIIAPGNPFGLSMTANGLGNLVGGQGTSMGSGFSPGFFSSMGYNTGVPSYGSGFMGGGGASPFSLMGGGNTPFGSSFIPGTY